MIVKFELMYASLLGTNTISYVEVEDQELHISLLQELFEYIYDVVYKHIECNKGMQLHLRNGYKQYYEMIIPTLGDSEYVSIPELFKTEIGNYNNIIKIELIES